MRPSSLAGSPPPGSSRPRVPRGRDATVLRDRDGTALSAPPPLAACPCARYVIKICPQPGRPRSGCAAGPFAPRGGHGPPHLNRIGHRGQPCASSPRLRQPAARSACACPGSATHGWPLWLAAPQPSAMSAARRARPTARTLRTGGRAATRLGSSARTWSAVQCRRRSARGKRMRRARELQRRDTAVPRPRYRAERHSPHTLATATQETAAATVKLATAFEGRAAPDPTCPAEVATGPQLACERARRIPDAPPTCERAPQPPGGGIGACLT